MAAAKVLQILSRDHQDPYPAQNEFWTTVWCPQSSPAPPQSTLLAWPSWFVDWTWGLLRKFHPGFFTYSYGSGMPAETTTTLIQLAHNKFISCDVCTTIHTRAQD